ncbi:MAG: hypothetical protein IH598_05900 [Bacteroidales bacterium]|nr:hypothetical protein [Bacteroidales bacterium]
MEQQDHLEMKPVEKLNKRRSLGLSILLIFSFAYNVLLLIVMVVGLFSKEIVLDVLQQYFKQVLLPDYTALAITLSGAIIFSISLFGLILLWLMKKMGFYFYASAQAIMLAVLIFFFKVYDPLNMSIAVAVIVIIGMHTKMMR